MNRLHDVLRARGQLRRAAADLDGSWQLRRIERTVSQTAVAHVSNDAGERAVLKVATGTLGQAALRREAQVLRSLHSQTRLGNWRHLVPVVLQGGAADVPSHLLLSRLPGHAMPPAEISPAAVGALGPLHSLGERDGHVDGLLERIVNEPAGRLQSVLTAPDQARLDRLVESLHGDLSGRITRHGWVHGDLHPGNLLFDVGGAVSGIVDWEQARPDDLPAIDVAFWLLTTAPGRRTLGPQIAARLDNGCWTGDELQILIGADAGDPLPGRDVLLLAWLRHVAGNLAKADWYGTSSRWLANAVLPVLRAVPRTAPVPVPVFAVSHRNGTSAAAATEPAADVESGPARWRRHLHRGLAAVGAGARRVRDRCTAETIRTVAPRLALLPVALVLWLISLPRVSLGSMTDLGLVAVLPVTYWIALGLLVGAAGVLIHTDRSANWIVGSYVAAIALVLHATPAILYSTPRYAWTWKHIGVVDYIVRHGVIHPHVPGLFSAYMGWPSFFALNAVLVKAGHLSSALSYAAWAPPVFELAALIPLRLIYGALLTNRRQIWLALLIFYLANWVGQDYFSPQAYSYLLYLVVLAVCLRWLPSTATGPVGRWRAWLLAPVPGRPAQRPQRRTVIAVVLLLFLAIVSSHQLTPFMLFTALCVLVLARATGPAWLPAALLGLTVVWISTMAWGYLGQNLYWIVASIGHPAANTQTTFVSLSGAGFDQRLVDWSDRGLTAGLVVLASIGWLRSHRAGTSARLPGLLALSPTPLLVANNYGGEMLFRVYLFALPWLALLAAAAIYPTAARRGRTAVWRAAVPVSLVLVLGSVFSIAYYGKEKMNYFPPGEVTASRWLYRHAPTGATVLAPTANFPWAFQRLNEFQYIFMEDLPAAQRVAIASDPVPGIQRILGVNRPVYVVLSDTQQVEGDYAGTLPSGLVTELEQRLPTAAGYHIAYRNSDTTIVETGGS